MCVEYLTTNYCPHPDHKAQYGQPGTRLSMCNDALEDDEDWLSERRLVVKLARAKACPNYVKETTNRNTLCLACGYKEQYGRRWNMTTTANSGTPRETTAAIASNRPSESPGLATHPNASSFSRPATTQQSRNDRSLPASTDPFASRTREGTMSAALGRIEQGFGHWNLSSLERNTGQLPPIRSQFGQELISRTPGVDDPSSHWNMRQLPPIRPQPVQNFMPNAPSMDVSSSHRNMGPPPYYQQTYGQSLAPDPPAMDHSISYGNTGQLPPIQQQYAQERISDTPGVDDSSSHRNTGRPPSFHQQSRQSLAPDTPTMGHLSSYRNMGPPSLPQPQHGQTLAPHISTIVSSILHSMGQPTLVQPPALGFTSRTPGMDYSNSYGNMGQSPFVRQQARQNSPPRTPPCVLPRSPSNISQPRPVEQWPTIKTLNTINSSSRMTQSIGPIDSTPGTSGADQSGLPNDMDDFNYRNHIAGMLERRARGRSAYAEADGQEMNDEMEEDDEQEENDGQEEEAVRQDVHEQGKDPSPWREFLNDDY